MFTEIKDKGSWLYRIHRGFSVVLNKSCLLSLIVSKYSELKQILDNKPDPDLDRHSAQGWHTRPDFKKHLQHARKIKFIILKGNI